MTRLKKQIDRLNSLLVIFFFAFLTFVFFWKFFLKGLVPIPADIIVGLYYPWLDYKWGFPTGVPVKNPLPSDIPSLVYPWRMFVIETLKSGVFPLWNPYYFAGMPLLANFQSAVFSLSNIFFLFFPKINAWSIGIISQSFLTMFFTFLFLRHLKLSKIAAIFGGIVFAFSGFSLMWLEYNLHGWVGMWLPLLLLITDKIIETKKIKWVFLGSFILAIQIFAGYPQIVFYSLTAVAFYTVFFRHSLSLRVVLFVLLGISLAAVQILPGWEALRLSVRKIDPIANLSSGGFLPWENLIALLAPDFFGNPATYNFWGRPWYDNFALYVGVLPLVFTVFTVFLRKDRVSQFFTFLVFFALLLALPNPVAKWISKTGIYGVNAISARIIFLLDFSLAILAALGLDWLITKFKNDSYQGNKNRKKILIILFVFLAILFSLWFFVLTANKFFPQAEWLIHLSVAKRNLILPTAIFFLLVLILIFLLFFKKYFPPYFFYFSIILILFLGTFDLFRFGWKYLPFSKPELVFPLTPTIEFLQSKEKPFRVEFGETIPQNMWMTYGLESAAGYDAMAPLRYTQFLGALRTGKVDNPYGRVAQVENYESKLFDLLNIKYVLAVKFNERGERGIEGKPRPIFQDPKFKLVFEDKSVQIYENINALPRAFLVHNIVFKKNDQEIIDEILSPKFDLSKSIVLEESVDLEDGKFDSQKESVNYLKYTSQESVIKTNSEIESFLFVADAFYPGWQAFIDGKETKIYRANFAFRAVKVPAGIHEVKFIYNPVTFRLGLFISLGTFLMILSEVGVVFFVKIIPKIIKRILKV